MRRQDPTIPGTIDQRNDPLKRLTMLLSLMIVAAAWLACLTARGQETRQALPNVTMIGVPTYPATARTTRLEGVVRLRVTTDGQRVADTELQDGPELLAVAAQDNLRTWQFSPHDPTAFTVTYRYKLTGLVGAESPAPSVVLRLPTEVVVCAIPRTTVDYAPDKTPKN